MPAAAYTGAGPGRAAAAAMAESSVPFGRAMVPGQRSFPVGATKTAAAASPSIPSQSVSAKPRSGRSGPGWRWHSQPFAGSPSTSTNGSAQATPHAPPAQVATWPGPAVQAFPQAPQFAGSVSREVQVVPQRVASGQVAEAQAPSMQASPSPHGTPQTPQFPASRERSVQKPRAPAPQASGCADGHRQAALVPPAGTSQT